MNTSKLDRLMAALSVAWKGLCYLLLAFNLVAGAWVFWRTLGEVGIAQIPPRVLGLFLMAYVIMVFQCVRKNDREVLVGLQTSLATLLAWTVIGLTGLLLGNGETVGILVLYFAGAAPAFAIGYLMAGMATCLVTPPTDTVLSIVPNPKSENSDVEGKPYA